MSAQLALRVLLYARVSYPTQKRRKHSDRDEPSIPQQFEEMEAEARRRGWTSIGRCEDVLTGAIPVQDRPGGRLVYEKAQAEEFDVLMIYDNDRLGRDEDAVVAKVFRADMRFLGRQIYSVHQPVEPKDPGAYQPYEDDSALWLEAVSDTASSVYIRQFRRRRAFGMRKRVEQKKLMPGKVPIGYIAERHTLPNGRVLLGKRDRDPVYAPVVQRIFAEYEAGASALAVAVRLNQDGLRTPAGNLWCDATIRGILDNPVYYGAVVYQKHRCDGPPHPRYPRRRVSRDQPMESWLIVDGGEHPAIISKEQWLHCQEIKRSRGAAGRTFGESTLLSGLVRCGKCAGPMARSGSWEGGYWVCRLARRTGRTQCEPNSIRVRAVEQAALNYLANLAREPKMLDHLLVGPRSDATASREEELKTVEGSLARITARLEKARDAYEAGIDSLVEFGERKAVLETERQPLERRQNELVQQVQSVTRRRQVSASLTELLQEFPDRFRERPLRLQKALLREILEAVTVTDGQVHLRLRDDIESPSDYDRLMKIIHAYSESNGPHSSADASPVTS